MHAIEKHIPERWVILYIVRWLTSPVITKSGYLVPHKGKGTPQVDVISPLLVNFFLNYGLINGWNKTII